MRLKKGEKLNALVWVFIKELGKYISFCRAEWKKEGCCMAVANIAILLYGNREQSRKFLFCVFNVTLQHIDDLNILPYAYIIFEYLYFVSLYNLDATLNFALWKSIVVFLNNFRARTTSSQHGIESAVRTLPEDYALLVMSRCQFYSGKPWLFKPGGVKLLDATEPYYIISIRINRILLLGKLLAKVYILSI